MMKKESKTTIRIISVLALVFLVAVPIGINTYRYYTNPPDETVIDSNVYLNEEVCFAKEVYISVVGINVDKEDDNYLLNLKVNVEQRCVDNKPDNVYIEPSNFVLKSVNLKAKSQMNVFFEALFKATISVLVSGAVDGAVNVIEETLSFALDYTTEAISAAVDADTKFKKVKANNTFEPFYPKDNDGVKTLYLSFPIKVANLQQTNNVIVLTIDQRNHVERRIFLILRPQNTVSPSSLETGT